MNRTAKLPEASQATSARALLWDGPMELLASLELAGQQIILPEAAVTRWRKRLRARPEEPLRVVEDLIALAAELMLRIGAPAQPAVVQLCTLAGELLGSTQAATDLLTATGISRTLSCATGIELPLVAAKEGTPRPAGTQSPLAARIEHAKQRKGGAR